MLNTLYNIPPGVATRWASPENFGAETGAAGRENAGRKGSACLPIHAGESRVLAACEGVSGTVRRIWITISGRTSALLRGMRLDCYWDGCAKPAISAPLGDFFGHGLGRMARFQNALFASPEGRSFNCCAPMPFRTGMKIVVTNEADIDQGSLYYDVDFTVGDDHGPDVAYLHACWRRENPTTLQRDYEILPRVEGRGRFLGANIGVIADQGRYFKSWWGEGEVKVYLDGDADLPTLAGTGTEDYIGTGWGQGRYDQLFQGCTVADSDHMQFGFYRYHVPDPVYFARDARVTIQQIGCWDPGTKMQLTYLGETVYKAGAGLVPLDLTKDGGSNSYGLFERQDDWSSCALFYLDKPANDLPPLQPVAERCAGLLDEAPISG